MYTRRVRCFARACSLLVLSILGACAGDAAPLAGPAAQQQQPRVTGPERQVTTSVAGREPQAPADAPVVLRRHTVGADGHALALEAARRICRAAANTGALVTVESYRGAHVDATLEANGY